MALVPIRVDRTSKPPLGTPLRSDGHWSVQGMVGAWAFNEGGGKTAFDAANSYNGAGGSTAKITEMGAAFDGTANSRFLIGDKPQLKLVDITIFCRFYDNGGTVTGALCGKATNTYAYQLIVSHSNQQIEFGVAGASGVVKTPALSVGGSLNFLHGRWNTVAATYDGKTATCVINGGERTNSAARTGSVINANPFSIGTRGDSSLPFNSTISETYLYNRALSTPETSSLSANPWQIYEPETVWVEVWGGGEAALFAGSVYGQSSASAQLSTAITIASQVVAAGSIAGGINSAIRLATGAQGSASASALLTTAIRMAASSQGHGSSTADLSTSISLAADMLAVSSTSGVLSTAIRFGGALSGDSTTTAALTNAITLAAQAAGLGSISGQLSGTVAAALFAGAIAGSSSASANLSTAVVLAAAAQGNSTAQATLSTALELAAQVNGIGSAAGTLGADISGLAGSLHGSSEAQATLATAIHLMGLAAGQCAVIGRLAEPVEILAQLRVMASDPLALTISVRDPLAIRVTVH